MNKIYTLKKEILFKNNIYDIVSIDIDKDLKINENKIEGTFKLKGDYLITSTEQDSFSIDIPYNEYIEDIYDCSNSKIDIDDFYYEIKDSTKLVINIDIMVTDLLEKDIVREDIEIIDDNNDNNDNNITIDNDIIIDNEVKEESINTNFVTYKVYIVKDGDTIESILEKYGISYELLTSYNTINEINSGDKLIIPYERD